MKMETDHPVWRQFKSWCHRIGVSPLPAHAWTVASFLAHYRERHPRNSLRVALRVISRVHLAAGLASPDRATLVRGTLGKLESRRSTRALRAALFRDSDFLEGAAESDEKAGETKDKDQDQKRKRRVRRLTNQPRLRSAKHKKE